MLPRNGGGVSLEKLEVRVLLKHSLTPLKLQHFRSQKPDSARKASISQPPSHYLKKIWMDSICYDQDVLMSSYAYSGADKILLGTDFPPK